MKTNPRILPMLMIILAVALVFNGCQNMNTVNPTNYPVAITSTAAITSTNEPTPHSISRTPTANIPATTAIPSPTPESFRPTSVLSTIQQQALIDSAALYISDSQEKADATVRAMNYATGANASLTCGPLAAAILRDAGLISPYFDLNEFWLVSPLPDMNEKLFLEVFPPGQYEWNRDTTPMAEMDFNKDPLLTGDFIYTFGGNYEHMFVVTRVDETGRAFTVENIEAGYLNGDPEDTSFVIAETLLYDPSNPGAGVIYQWADKVNWKLGLTGIDGYLRFRPIQEIPAPDPAKTALAESIDGIIESTGGRWYIRIDTLEGDVLYARRPALRIHPASVIKVAIAVGTMELLESQQETGQTLEQQLARGPIYNETENDRSYQQLLTAMLVNSEEDAADILLENLLGSPLRIKEMLLGWGMTDTTLEPRQSTVDNLTTLFRGLYRGDWLSTDATEYLLNLMRFYTPNDDLRLGQIKTVLGDDAILYDKRGSLLAPQLIVADTAILEYDGGVYLLQVFAFQDVENSITYEELEAAIGRMAISFGQWLLDQ